MKLYRETNEPVRTKTRTFNQETGSLLLPSDTKKAQVIHPICACFSSQWGVCRDTKKLTKTITSFCMALKWAAEMQRMTGLYCLIHFLLEIMWSCCIQKLGRLGVGYVGEPPEKDSCWWNWGWGLWVAFSLCNDSSLSERVDSRRPCSAGDLASW